MPKRKACCPFWQGPREGNCFAGTPAVQHLALYPESRKILTRQMLFSGSELPVDGVGGGSFLRPGNSVKWSRQEWVIARTSLGSAGHLCPILQLSHLLFFFGYANKEAELPSSSFFISHIPVQVTPLSSCLDLPLFNLTSKKLFPGWPVSSIG